MKTLLILFTFFFACFTANAQDYFKKDTKFVELNPLKWQETNFTMRYEHRQKMMVR